MSATTRECMMCHHRFAASEAKTCPKCTSTNVLVASDVEREREARIVKACGVVAGVIAVGTGLLSTFIGYTPKLLSFLQWTHPFRPPGTPGGVPVDRRSL